MKINLEVIKKIQGDKPLRCRHIAYVEMNTKLTLPEMSDDSKLYIINSLDLKTGIIHINSEPTDLEIDDKLKQKLIEHFSKL